MYRAIRDHRPHPDVCHREADRREGDLVCARAEDVRQGGRTYVRSVSAGIAHQRSSVEEEL